MSQWAFLHIFLYAPSTKNSIVTVMRHNPVKCDGKASRNLSLPLICSISNFHSVYKILKKLKKIAFYKNFKTILTPGDTGQFGKLLVWL